MFAIILVERTNTSIFFAKKDVQALSESLRSVFEINAPPEILILSRVKMAAVDSSDTKKFFFFPARLRGEEGEERRGVVLWRIDVNLYPIVRHVNVCQAASRGELTPTSEIYYYPFVDIYESNSFKFSHRKVHDTHQHTYNTLLREQNYTFWRKIVQMSKQNFHSPH